MVAFSVGSASVGASDRISAWVANGRTNVLRGTEVRERVRDHGGVGPVGRLTREERVDERDDARGRLRQHVSQRRRFLVHATQPECKAILVFERQPAAQEQEEDATKGVHVAGGVAAASHRLLRRPVLGCSDQHAGERQGAGAPRDPREAEVARQHPAGFALDQDARGRQVAVDDTSSMRVGQRPRDRCCVRGRLRDREGQAAERRLSEVAAVDVLHHEERLLADADVVEDADDVVVRECGERPGLAVEPASLLGLVGDGRAQQLDGDVALEPAVAGAPDHTHAALADLLEQLVAADQDPVGGRRSRLSTQHIQASATPAISGGNSTAARLHEGTNAAGGVCLARRGR